MHTVQGSARHMTASPSLPHSVEHATMQQLLLAGLQTAVAAANFVHQCLLAGAPTWLQRVTGAVASLGSGRMISTFVATLRSLNWLRALTM